MPVAVNGDDKAMATQQHSVTSQSVRKTLLLSYTYVSQEMLYLPVLYSKKGWAVFSPIAAMLSLG